MFLRKKFFFLAFSFFPLALVIGNIVAELIIILLIFFLFIDLNKNIIFDSLRNKILLIFILFYIIAIISSIFSDFWLASLRPSIFNWRFIFFIITAHFILQKNQTKLILLFKTFSILLIFLSVDGIFQYYFNYNLLGMNKLHEIRVSGVFGKKLVLGSFLSKIYPLYLSLYFYLIADLKKIYKASIYIVTFLVTVAIVISGERAALYHFLLFIFLIILFLFPQIKSKKYFFLTLIFIFIFIFQLFVKDYSYKKRLLNPAINLFSHGILFTPYHNEHFETAIKIFLNNKIIGSGPNTFRFKCLDFVDDQKLSQGINACATHPHNTYLQLLSETGILGFFLIVILFTVFCINYCKIFFYNYKNNFVPNNSYLTIISAFIVYLFPISTNGNFFNNWLNCIFSLYFIFYLFFSKEFKRQYKII